jgi:hypothetical protein
LPPGIAHRLEGLDLNSGRIASFFQHLAEQTEFDKLDFESLVPLPVTLEIADELIELLVSDLNAAAR